MMYVQVYKCTLKPLYESDGEQDNGASKKRVVALKVQRYKYTQDIWCSPPAYRTPSQKRNVLPLSRHSNMHTCPHTCVCVYRAGPT